MFPRNFVAPCPIVHGTNRIDRLGDDLDKLVNATASAVVVCDRGVSEAGIVNRVRDAVAAHRAVLIIDDATPVAASIEQASAAIRQTDAGCIIGLGGGSALDAAKLVAATLDTERPLESYALSAQPFPTKRLPTILIPTTAGTGSEVTRTAIFTARDGRKLWAWGDALRADLAILDPTLCLDLPAPLTVATGLDALVHAIEACTAKRRDTTISAWGDDAIRRVVRSLPMAIATPQDVEVRLDLQIAACVAGACIENCGTGVAHALGHALETVANVHHGRGVALSLDAAISWNAVGHASAYSAITSALGGVDPPPAR